MNPPHLTSNEGWREWSTCYPIFYDVPIELVHPRFGSSVICFATLAMSINLSGFYWRRTGIYREREEIENARNVAERLMGRKRLVMVDSGSTSARSTGMAMVQNIHSQQQSFYNSLLGGLGASQQQGKIIP